MTKTIDRDEQVGRHGATMAAPQQANGGTSRNYSQHAALDRARTQPSQAPHKLLEGLGAIVSVLIKSPSHNEKSLASLDAAILPAVATGQFAIAQATIRNTGVSKPVAFLTWANFSDEVDAALQKTIDMPFPKQPNEWRGGNVVWITEAAGESKHVMRLIEHHRRTIWRGRTVRLRAIGTDEKTTIMTLPIAGDRPEHTQISD